VVKCYENVTHRSRVENRAGADFERVSNQHFNAAVSGGSVGREASGRDQASIRVRVWFVAGALVLIIAVRLDDSVQKVFELGPQDTLIPFARWMSRLGEGWVVAAAGTAISVILALFGRLVAARLAILAAISGLLTGAVATVLRTVIGRTRPNVDVAQGFYGMRHDAHWIVGQYDFSSFPSGHAATVVGVAAAVWLVNRKLGVLVGIYAALVCWSRVANGCHHPSDIVGACVLGILGGYGSVRLLWPRLEPGVARLIQGITKGS